MQSSASNYLWDEQAANFLLFGVYQPSKNADVFDSIA